MEDEDKNKVVDILSRMVIERMSEMDNIIKKLQELRIVKPEQLFHPCGPVDGSGHWPHQK